MIKDNKLMGLYHSKRYCPIIHRELASSHGEIHTIKRKIKRSNPYYCRFCTYIEAEEKGINCYEICQQMVCLKNEKLPEAMRKEVEKWKGSIVGG